MPASFRLGDSMEGNIAQDYLLISEHLFSYERKLHQLKYRGVSLTTLLGREFIRKEPTIAGHVPEFTKGVVGR